MLSIVKEEIFDGYKIIEYSNGAVVKQSVNAVDGSEVPQEEPPLSATEQAMLQMAISMEYMAAMMEVKE